MSAFREALEAEMRGAVEDCWYNWLRGLVDMPLAADKEALRARARELTNAGELPPVPDYDD
jgi:hypothetical protein